MDVAELILERQQQDAQTPEQANVERAPYLQGDEIPRKAKGGKEYGLVLENGGGTTVGPVQGRAWKLPNRTFWKRPLGRHFVTATIPAGAWLYVWQATSSQPVTVGLAPAPSPEILDHLTGHYPASLFDEALRENTQGTGFVFQQWMAWAAVAGAAVLAAAALTYMHLQKKGLV